MAIATTDPLLGRLVDGRYEIARRLARGGMATVYLATDRRLDREVAIKIMHPHLADGVDGAAFVSRFRREARAAARLSHPGVVAVYDQGLDGDTSYLAMEYVPGTNLRHELRESAPLTVERTFDVLAQVLEALAAAHRKGLVHRDVKPENVLVTAGDDGTKGRVKVADFGLARAVTEVTSTATGTILGTVAYLAPEVITSGTCDARTDVYAVGVLAYEMLTGTLPYAGEPPIQVAFAHVHSDFPLPSALVPWLPPEIDDLVRRFTSRDAPARPDDATAALELLEGLRGGLDGSVLDRRADQPAPAPGTPPRGVDVVDPDDEAGSPDEVDAIPTAFFQELSVSSPDPHAQATEHLVEQPTEMLADTRPPRRRRVVAWTLVAVLLLGGGSAGGWWWFTDGPGAWTSVPSGVAGLPAEEVRSTLLGAGLDAQKSAAYDDDVPAGDVVTTRPAPGEAVRKDGTVEVVVSLGVQMLTVPTDLVGSARKEATAALKDAGLAVGSPDLRYDDEEPKGTVLDVSADEGSSVRHDAPVRLTVSNGPAPVQVPQEVGRSKDDAVAELEALGLKVALADPEYSEEIPEGHVLEQGPEHGETAHRTDTVILTISQGPPLVVVPDVVGQSSAEASRALRRAGLEVKKNTYLGGVLDKVRFQDTSGKAPKGSTVTLTIW